MPGRSRRRKEALDGLGQLFQPYGLVEVNAVMTGNIAQRACRYVTGQDDDRDPTMKLGAQLLNNLKSIQTLRQIVVREDEIRPNLASRDEIKRSHPVWRRRGIAPLLLEQEIEELAYLRVVLDDQNSASALRRFGNRLIDVRVTVIHLYGG